MGSYVVCECGECIRVEFVWNGLAYVPYYFRAAPPEELAEEFEDEQVEHCPGCGEWLGPRLEAER